MAPEAAGWLRVVEQELKAVLNNVLGPEPTTQFAAHHCQQAAEKLVKAVLISAGVDPPRWHNIHDLIDLLPPDHHLKAKLEPLGRITPFAVAFRYPAQDPDVLPAEPSPDEILAWRRELDEIKSLVAATIRSQS